MWISRNQNVASPFALMVWPVWREVPPTLSVPLGQLNIYSAFILIIEPGAMLHMEKYMFILYSVD